MYSVHATKKLLDRLKAPVGPPVIEPSTALGNWCATAILWRPKVPLFVNDKTFLSVFVALAPAASLLTRFPAAVGTTLDALGIDSRFVAAELDAICVVTVAKTADRRVLGVMNELAFQAEVRHAHNFDVADLASLSVEVAHLLLTPLFKDRAFVAELVS